MNLRWKRPLVAILLVAALVFALPVSGFMAQAVDLTQKCSLNVNPGTYEDLANADVVIDLYKVADAVADETYDTYGYEVLGAYASLSDSLGKEDKDWSALAQEAAQVTLTSGQSIAKTVDAAEVNKSIADLDCGLYLLIARGDKVKNYVTSVTNDGSESIATMAYSDEYVYTFSPELISLPGKAADVDGVVSTSNPGEWIYNMDVTLKPEQSVRFGDLQITKTLESYEGSEPATFVFQIEASMRGETVYSNVAALTFTAAGQRQILIEDQIPVGAEVTVTEIYSGAKYTLTSSESAVAAILAPDDGTASVSFSNTYDGSNKGGSGLVNHFSKDESGWTVDNSRDNGAE